jgi:predicted dithiol-disulfide oxidoreductase (DUF899 family)
VARRTESIAGQGEGAHQGTRRPATLLDLFDGRRQLIVDHAMWTFDVDEHGAETPRDVACPSCSARLDG